MSTAKATAFVLSGGASLGAIQAGMLRALYERRISPDLIVGSSVGSVNGAFIASRLQTPATAIELASVWRTLSRGEVFPLNPITGLLGFLGSRDHLVPKGSLRSLIREHIVFGRLGRRRSHCTGSGPTRSVGARCGSHPGTRSTR